MRLTTARVLTSTIPTLENEFLLEREDKNSILRRFDITQIYDYFPEFEKEIKK